MSSKTDTSLAWGLAKRIMGHPQAMVRRPRLAKERLLGLVISVGIKSHVEKSCPQVFEAVSSQGQTRFALPSGHFFCFYVFIFFSFLFLL